MRIFKIHSINLNYYCRKFCRIPIFDLNVSFLFFIKSNSQDFSIFWFLFYCHFNASICCHLICERLGQFTAIRLFFFGNLFLLFLKRRKLGNWPSLVKNHSFCEQIFNLRIYYDNLEIK